MTDLPSPPSSTAAGRPVPGSVAGPIRRVAITNLGCKVNQAEMDALERLLRGRGVDVTADGRDADLHVVNTCTVTAVAEQKSRKAVRRARRDSPSALVVATGCAVEVGPGAFLGIDPAATVLANEAKDGLLAEVERLLGSPGIAPVPAGPIDGPLPTLAGVEPVEEAVDGPAEGLLAGPVEERPAGVARIGRTRAYLKVQDGCSFHCTYCIIPRARGPERSVPPDGVLADARRALAGGHRELVLTGINVGTYDGGEPGRGLRQRHRPATSLAGLVRRLLAETSVERIRISSIEPQHVDDELLATIAGSGGRCLPHLHVPLQSGDDGVLRRMGRRYDTAFYARTVERARAALPGVAIHADVIAGFPTEDEAAWALTVGLVDALGLDGLHVFRYSGRPGTPSTRMAGQVPESVRRARAAELLALAGRLRRARVARAAGTERLVLFETPVASGGWLGHAEDMVAVRATTGDGRSLDGEIARVFVDGPDPEDRDRAHGRVVALVPRPEVVSGRTGVG
jgi:threonylcarbamoyladenosine tRNA methylthiotransferase MtaB